MDMKMNNDKETKVNMDIENDPNGKMKYKANDMDIEYKSKKDDNITDKYINDGIKYIQHKLQNLIIENDTKLQNNKINNNNNNNIQELMMRRRALARLG